MFPTLGRVVFFSAVGAISSVGIPAGAALAGAATVVAGTAYVAYSLGKKKKKR